jgi:hypothetical protein
MTSLLTLPLEVLERILLFTQRATAHMRVSDEDADIFRIDSAWINVLVVCSHLRSVALSTPELWAHVDCTIGPNKRWIEICVERAKDVPLILSDSIAEFRPFEDRGHASSDLHYLPRAERARICYNFPESYGLGAIEARPAPFLRVLDLRIGIDEPHQLASIYNFLSHTSLVECLALDINTHSGPRPPSRPLSFPAGMKACILPHLRVLKMSCASWVANALLVNLPQPRDALSIGIQYSIMFPRETVGQDLDDCVTEFENTLALITAFWSTKNPSVTLNGTMLAYRTPIALLLKLVYGKPFHLHEWVQAPHDGHRPSSVHLHVGCNVKGPDPALSAITGLHVVSVPDFIVQDVALGTLRMLAQLYDTARNNGADMTKLDRTVGNSMLQLSDHLHGLRYVHFDSPPTLPDLEQTLRQRHDTGRTLEAVRWLT